MHAATSSACDGRRSAGLIGPRFGPAAKTGKHRSGVARVIARHLRRYRRIFFGTTPRSLGSSMIDIGAVSAWGIPVVKLLLVFPAYSHGAVGFA